MQSIIISTSRRSLVAGLSLALLGGCAASGIDRPAGASSTAKCDVQSVNSPPGRIWWKEQRWRYTTDADATAAYQAITTGNDAWPNWFTPHEQDLAVGVRFQMAVSKGQPETSPGGFGTFDDVASVRDVRRYLAVRYAWKPEVDRVVTYEVIKPLPVKIGPIGPQTDPHGCAWLPGRWSQLQMLVPPATRIDYLKVIGVRSIK
ncbi:hypothetical protein NDN01_10540 [Sphingomonas sp. QA11]|uniref:hypothetical protein n=1 Tax=Sphingomonas sp. QA11 TaxID=2950605 RepID=UPI002349861A|nr:hypothetical protein [Sphingomonas sp. QA11]WCM29284.1 hypothetical protein NDN01_10540 [Sphingomonas sp. QA11]